MFIGFLGMRGSVRLVLKAKFHSKVWGSKLVCSGAPCCTMWHVYPPHWSRLARREETRAAAEAEKAAW